MHPHLHLLVIIILINIVIIQLWDLMIVVLSVMVIVFISINFFKFSPASSWTWVRSFSLWFSLLGRSSLAPLALATIICVRPEPKKISPFSLYLTQSSFQCNTLESSVVTSTFLLFALFVFPSLFSNIILLNWMKIKSFRLLKLQFVPPSCKKKNQNKIWG